jgi:hypothetical protein
MKRITALSVLLAALTLASQSSFASHSVEGSYTLATVVVSCAPDCLGEPGLNLGGYKFAIEDEVPVTATVADASGGAVAFSVCQDFNANAICGEAADPNLGTAAEPQVVVCGTTADLTKSTVPFVATKETSVFVSLIDADCAGVATSGTVTLTYA